MNSKLEKYNRRLCEAAQASQTWERFRDQLSFTTSMLFITSTASLGLFQAMPSQEKNIVGGLLAVTGFVTGMLGITTSLMTAVTQVGLTTSKASHNCLTFFRRAHIRRNPTIVPQETLVRGSAAPSPPPETVLVRPVYETTIQPEQLLRAGQGPAP